VACLFFDKKKKLPTGDSPWEYCYFFKPSAISLRYPRKNPRMIPPPSVFSDIPKNGTRLNIIVNNNTRMLFTSSFSFFISFCLYVLLDVVWHFFCMYKIMKRERVKLFFLLCRYCERSMIIQYTETRRYKKYNIMDCFIPRNDERSYIISKTRIDRSLHSDDDYPPLFCAASRIDQITQNTDVAIIMMIPPANTIITGSINLEMLEIPFSSSSE